MITKQERRIIQESKKAAHEGSRRLLAEKINSYHTLVFNEGFFDKIKKMGQGIASGAKALGSELIPGMSNSSGGAGTQDLDAELPEMKALSLGVKKIEAAKNKLLGYKLADVNGLDAALDTYVQTLVDLYSEFKDITDNPEKSGTLPNATMQVVGVFKTAKQLIAGLMRAFDDANKRLGQAVPKDSPVSKQSFTLPPPRRGVPAVNGASAPRGDMGWSGVGGASISPGQRAGRGNIVKEHRSNRK